MSFDLTSNMSSQKFTFNFSPWEQSQIYQHQVTKNIVEKHRVCAKGFLKETYFKKFK